MSKEIREISAAELSTLREKQMVQEAVRQKAWPTDSIELDCNKEAIHEQLKKARRDRTSVVRSNLP